MGENFWFMVSIVGRFLLGVGLYLGGLAILQPVGALEIYFGPLLIACATCVWINLF